MIKMRTSTLVCTLFLLSLLCFQASAHGGIDDGDGEDAPAAPAEGASLRSKGLIAVKVWCLVILLVFTFLGGVSPYFYRWNEAFLILGTQFAAGIFLGTSLMHFLADSTTTFRGLTKNHYPFSYKLACVGFLLTMLADCVIVAVAHRSRDRGRVDEAAEEGHARHKEDGSGGANAAHAHPMLVRTSSFEDAILLIVALCFHSVFEGMP